MNKLKCKFHMKIKNIHKYKYITFYFTWKLYFKDSALLFIM